MRNFSDLTEREILALAIANEEEDGRIYLDIAEGLRADIPAAPTSSPRWPARKASIAAGCWTCIAAKFGEHIPLIRRQDVRGFIQHKPVWQMSPLNLKSVRLLAEDMETETQAFYRRAAARSEDVTIRKLLGDLADAEVEHEHRADQLVVENLPGERPPARGCSRPPILRAAGDPARPGRTDGRFCLHPGAGVRRRVRVRQHVADASSSGWRPRLAPGSRWASLKRCRTTAA